MKFTLEWQIMTIVDGLESEPDRVKISEHDTRTAIDKSGLSPGDREKPCKTKIVLKTLDLSM